MPAPRKTAAAQAADIKTAGQRLIAAANEARADLAAGKLPEVLSPPSPFPATVDPSKAETVLDRMRADLAMAEATMRDLESRIIHADEQCQLAIEAANQKWSKTLADIHAQQDQERTCIAGYQAAIEAMTTPVPQPEAAPATNVVQMPGAAE